jgi:hypothetical protein
LISVVNSEIVEADFPVASANIETMVFKSAMLVVSFKEIETVFSSA